jgi:hypothetical protein
MLRIKTHFFLLLILSLSIDSHSQSTGKDKGIYLIIVSDDYSQSASLSLLKTYREQDFNVQTVTGSSIGTTKDDYRNYIRNLMPAYVLLVGRYGDFPTHEVQYSSKVESYNYYVASSLTGHPAPDIPLGLFMVESEAELANIVSKTISYDTNLSSSPKMYYAHAGSNEALPPWPVTFNEEILTEMNTRYFSPNGYSFSLSTANDSTPNDVWTDINMINSGVHFMIYHGHGLIHKWSFGLGIGGLPQLNNSVYPVILSFACLTGSFSGEIGSIINDCFAQKIVADEHGAVAFLGAYNKSGRGMNLLMEGIVNGIFNDSINHRLGDALIHGFANTTNTNTVGQYYPTVTMAERTLSAWQFHLFGDPALLTRTNYSSGYDNFFQNKDLLKIFPNPANDYLRIEVSSKYEQFEVAIYALDGQILYNSTNETFINISDLEAGYYLAQVKLNNTNYFKRFVKIK